MFARFDENPAMTLQDIKETKRYGRTDGRTDGHTDGRTHGRTNNVKTVYPPQTKFAGGIMKELEWSQCFPHYNPMGAICCHGNQSSDPIRPKTLCSQSPTQMMLQMKFDYDRPPGLRDIHV